MADFVTKPEVTWAKVQLIAGKHGNGSYSNRQDSPNKISLLARVENSVTWENPPHFTIDLRPGMPSYQHIYVRFPAYALSIDANNKDGRTVQVCILGVNDSQSSWWTADRIDVLGKMLYDICKISGCVIKTPFAFKASSSDPDRMRYMSFSTYSSGAGIVGIQHDPFSPGRWGPGLMPESRVVSAINKYATLEAEEDAKDGPGPPGNAFDRANEEEEHHDKTTGTSTSKYADKDMSQKEFRFNPPLHNDLMPQRVDFSSGDPAGFMNDTYKDEQTFVFGSKDAGPLQKLRLGRIIQHEFSAGMAATNKRRMGFRFLYNPTQVSTSATRNDSVVIDPQSTIGAVLSGINQNFQTISFKVLLNRTADVLSRKTPTAANYPYQIYGDDIQMLRTYGTHWDLERLYRLCNGSFNMTDRGQSADIGVLIPANARLILGQGQNHFGFVESVAWTDQMFSENMVPVLTEVEIIFRRHVDMKPDERKSFVDSLTASGVAGSGGDEPGAQVGDTDVSGGSPIVPPGVEVSGAKDPMGWFKQVGLSGGAWTYKSKHDPYSKTVRGSIHRAWDIGTSYKPLLAGVTGVVAALNDGAPDNERGRNPGSGSPSNWIVVHTQYKGKPASVYYQHLKKGSVAVRINTRVTPTSYIATTGNSGNSDGPHLHLATMHTHVGGNPYYYLNGPESRCIWPPSEVFAHNQ